MTGELLRLIDELWANNSAEAAQELRRLSDRCDELAFIPDRLRGERDDALRRLNSADKVVKQLRHEIASLTETLGGLAHEVKAEQLRDVTVKDDLKAARKAAAFLHKSIRWDRDRIDTITTANERWPFLIMEASPDAGIAICVDCQRYACHDGGPSDGWKQDDGKIVCQTCERKRMKSELAILKGFELRARQANDEYIAASSVCGLLRTAFEWLEKQRTTVSV